MTARAAALRARLHRLARLVPLFLVLGFLGELLPNRLFFASGKVGCARVFADAEAIRLTHNPAALPRSAHGRRP